MRALATAAAFAFGLVSPAFAQTAAPTIDQVIASATLDFNGDSRKDRALLVASERGDADLYIYLGAGAGSDKDTLKLALVKKEFVFAGPMGGQDASLAVVGRGSLQVKSQNFAIGRTKWEQTLTVTHRNGEFIVAGVTYTAHDGLDPKGGGSCDINLVTGRGKRNGKDVSLKPETIPVAAWTDEKMPKECQF